jgi:riboflavin synthase
LLNILPLGKEEIKPFTSALANNRLRASITKINKKHGSWEYEFSFRKKFSELIIEKGSICVNGISLTAFDVKKKSFKVAIIPYTHEHTNIKTAQKGDLVNIEFDLIGKYILRKLSLNE